KSSSRVGVLTNFIGISVAQIWEMKSLLGCAIIVIERGLLVMQKQKLNKLRHLANVHNLENAQRARAHAKRLSEEQRQIALDLAGMVGVPEPTSEELKRMEQEIPADVLADDPPCGKRTPPKLLAQYYLWQTLD